MKTPLEILNHYWGFDSFRASQEKIIQSILEKKDTLALLPTGGGKSVCFQVPALLQEGICIVISPLIALMKDQIDTLHKKNIKAIAIHSGLSYSELDIALDNCIYGGYKFLYLSPEKLQNDLVKQRIDKMNINLIAVDEAHCISEWGYDFRPSYRKISDLRTICDAPVIALTASATSDVIEDIQKKLLFNKKNVISHSFFREELSYNVRKTEDIYTDLLKILNQKKGSSIVYCNTRKDTKLIAHFLNKNKIPSHYFHGGLHINERDKKQKEWSQNHVRAMVATNAFGMGIDKSNVKTVIHTHIPNSIESYFQESGRAGRDGKEANCYILYNDQKILSLKNQISTKYPDKKYIQKVYQSLVNQFSIAIGPISTIEQYEFDITSFCQNYSLDQLKTYNSLKILEKEELIKLSEAVHQPSKIHIKSSHNDLYQFQIANAQYDTVIKTLLRSYSGIFDTYINIQENLISKRCGININVLIKSLEKLNELKLLDYIKQNTNPKIYFINQRIDANKITFTKQNIKLSKKKDIQKANSIINYVQQNSMCRSSMILAYFDQKRLQNCNKCDICLGQKKFVDNKQFVQIKNVIKSSILNKKQNVEELLSNASEETKESYIKVIEYLLENEQLYINDKNHLIWIE